MDSGWRTTRAAQGRRWYKRSDGSHQFIFGNTHYTFLTEHGLHGKPTGGNIADDIAANARYFKKVRFGVQGGRYPHPTERPWLDDSGRPSPDGNYSHRPNPRWFHQRVDSAVRSAFEHDLIADMIIAGPDAPESRTTLKAKHNGGDATPYLRYLAARYGGFPNVWICLCNEYNIKNPKYTQAEVAKLGITINDELSYEGVGDKHTEADTIAAHLGVPYDSYIPEPERPIDKTFLMPVEDVFSIEGRGTVCTGRVERGIVKKMEEVEIVGIRDTQKTTVTDIEMFRKLLDEGRAGDNVGLLLRGLKKTDIERGQVIAKPGTRQAAQEVQGRDLRPVEGRRRPSHAVLLELPPAVLLPHHRRDRQHQASRRRRNGDARRQREPRSRADHPDRHGEDDALRHPRGWPHRRCRPCR